MGPSLTISEINGDFSRKSQIFPTTVYLTPPLKGLSSDLGIGDRSQKTRMMGLPARERSLTITSALWIQYIYTNVTDGRTDRQTDRRRTDTGRQQRPRLRIASRSNKTSARPTCIYAYRYIPLES